MKPISGLSRQKNSEVGEPQVGSAVRHSTSGFYRIDLVVIDFALFLSYLLCNVKETFEENVSSDNLCQLNFIKFDYLLNISLRLTNEVMGKDIWTETLTSVF